MRKPLRDPELEIPTTDSILAPCSRCGHQLTDHGSLGGLELDHPIKPFFYDGHCRMGGCECEWFQKASPFAGAQGGSKK